MPWLEGPTYTSPSTYGLLDTQSLFDGITINDKQRTFSASKGATLEFETGLNVTEITIELWLFMPPSVPGGLLMGIGDLAILNSNMTTLACSNLTATESDDIVG